MGNTKIQGGGKGEERGMVMWSRGIWIDWLGKRKCLYFFTTFFSALYGPRVTKFEYLGSPDLEESPTSVILSNRRAYAYHN